MRCNSAADSGCGDLPLEVGLRFGFEMWPSQSFERAIDRLPFGCHAWAKYDRSFLEPFLIPESITIPVRA